MTHYPVTRNRTSIFQCEDENKVGVDCNTTFLPCEIAAEILCQNNGTCHSDSSYPLKYYCKCPPGFSGYDCQQDKRSCKTNTCW